MKNNAFVIAFSLMLSSLLPSCTSHEQSGALGGALAGAAIGSRIGDGSGRAMAIFFGAVVGSELGKTIGRHMDEHDREKVTYMLENNKTNRQSAWRNPDSGYYYQAIPTNTYSTEGQPCREFTIDSEVGGKTQQVYGTACRQADGSWKIQK